MKSPFDIETLQELVEYLQGCVAMDGKEPRPYIASQIVETIHSNKHDEWYDDGDYSEYQELYEIACNMEAWPVYGLRESDWLRLKELVNILAQKVKQ